MLGGLFREEFTCQNMFIKVVNNSGEGWLITVEDDGSSALRKLFSAIFHSSFCIIRREEPRMEMEATCYI